MTALLLSIGALLLGPITHGIASRHPLLLSALDTFVFVAISGLVMLHILPQAFSEGGNIVFLLVFIGFAGPFLIEFSLKHASRHVHHLFLVLVMIGLGGHAFLDGLALCGSTQHVGHAGIPLAFAIVLHRIPDGLTLWWLLRGPYGFRVTSIVLGVMGMATIAGYMVGNIFSWETHHHTLSFIQALVGGMLLHVVFHRPHTEENTHLSKNNPVPTIIGTFFATGLLVLLEGFDANHGVSVFHKYLGLGALVVLFICKLTLFKEHKHEKV